MEVGEEQADNYVKHVVNEANMTFQEDNTSGSLIPLRCIAHYLFQNLKIF